MSAPQICRSYFLAVLAATFAIAAFNTASEVIIRPRSCSPNLLSVF